MGKASVTKQRGVNRGKERDCDHLFLIYHINITFYKEDKKSPGEMELICLLITFRF